LHGGKSTGPRTEEGRARIAAAQFKHGRRSKAFVEAQRANNAKGRAIKHELNDIESTAISDGLLPKGWQKAFELGL
jgi:protein-disulfide isomerase-like protein with CxxC motif